METIMNLYKKVVEERENLQYKITLTPPHS